MNTERFYELMRSSQSRFSNGGLKGRAFYGLVVTSEGNIMIRPTSGGLIVPADELEQTLANVKSECLGGGSFIVNKKKVKTVKGVIANL